ATPECWKSEAEKGSSNGRDRIVKEPTECGDASACLMLRTPVIRRDRCRLVQKMCPVKKRGSWPDLAESETSSVSWRGQNSGVGGQARLCEDAGRKQVRTPGRVRFSR